VKRLCLQPGCRLSLQRHRHRSEHWVVVAGTGRVLCDGEERAVGPGSTLLVPAGAVHRATADPDGPLLLVEVQRGALLREDDIERLADDYGRAPA
jgi:mannose-6-phosphate isomerase-like protein (cupin superfamily)